MALWFNLMINAEQIGQVEIIRAEGGTDPDDINTYEWTYRRGIKPCARGEIIHRYGDGAVELAHSVLGEIAERHRIAGEVTA